MSTIRDLIGQIQDAALRDRIAAEVERVVGEKKFGLMFEDHIPEDTPLYGNTAAWDSCQFGPHAA